MTHISVCGLSVQCLTGKSILTIICTRFISVLTMNRSNDNPFLSNNQPIQLSILLSCPKVDTPDGKSQIGMICNGTKNEHFSFLRFVFWVQFFTFRNVILLLFYTVQYVFCTSVISDSPPWTKFLKRNTQGTSVKCKYLPAKILPWKMIVGKVCVYMAIPAMVMEQILISGYYFCYHVLMWVGILFEPFWW